MRVSLREQTWSGVTDSNQPLGPDWGSFSIGVFLCYTCGALHRELGSHISRVKSIKLDNWDRTQVTRCLQMRAIAHVLLQVAGMEEVGNEKAREIYEKHVPIYYRRPRPNDPL